MQAIAPGTRLRIPSESPHSKNIAHLHTRAKFIAKRYAEGMLSEKYFETQIDADQSMRSIPDGHLTELQASPDSTKNWQRNLFFSKNK